MRFRVPLGATLFFLLLAATLVIAVFVVRARTPDLVLEVTDGLPTSLTPVVEGSRERQISFFVRESDPAARIAIVDGREKVVRTLDEMVELAADEEVTYSWDGRADDGAFARPGRYRLLVELPGEDREMIWPRRFTLDSPTPASDADESGEGTS